MESRSLCLVRLVSSNTKTSMRSSQNYLQHPYEIFVISLLLISPGNPSSFSSLNRFITSLLIERNDNYCYIFKNTLPAGAPILNSLYLESLQLLIRLNTKRSTTFSDQTFSSSCLTSTDHNMSLIICCMPVVTNTIK